MKIAVIGTHRMPSIIENAFDANLPDIEFVYKCSDFFEDAADIAKEIQEKHEADAILFSGRTSYQYACKRVSSTIPWTYLPHSRTAAFQACLEGMTIFHSDLKSISIDSFPPELLQDALHDVGIHDAEIFQAPYAFEEPDFEKKLRDFHWNCYQKGLVSVCFASMEHIAEPLRQMCVPCVRIYPVKEVIREQIYHLQILDLSSKKHQGSLAVIVLRLVSDLYSEKDLMYQEWDFFKFQNQFKEKVYTVARRMEAAVFFEDANQMYLVSSRSALTDIFLKNCEYLNLLNSRGNDIRWNVFLGVGVGNTMAEAKARAGLALNMSISSHSRKVYMVEANSQATELNTYPNADPFQYDIAHFAHQFHIHAATLERICQIIAEKGNSMTAYQLSEWMQISHRSANRIIYQFEKEGWAAVVGKQPSPKGRPARLIRFNLPENLLNIR